MLHVCSCPNKCQDNEAADTQPDKGVKGKSVRKCSAGPSNTGNERWKVWNISAGQGMITMAGSMDDGFKSLKDIITSAFQQASKSADFEVQSKAIKAIKREEGLSDEGIKDVALVITKDPSAANVYLTLKSEHACKLFLLENMKGLRR